MPTRSCRSAIMRWPALAEVDAAFRAWASIVKARHPEAIQVGYFGSYAQGTWGVGNDLDIVIVVSRSNEPFYKRFLDISDDGLPDPADILVFTQDEVALLNRRGSPLLAEIERTAV